MARPVGILMVCLGNICRSPMAEGALLHRLEEAGMAARARVDSVATGASHIGHAPDERAIACAARHGIDAHVVPASQPKLKLQAYADNFR